MKVVSSKQMAKIDASAYRDGISETDFMEEAGSGVALVVHDFAEREGIDHKIIMLCGKGNNAGDAYIAGINLLQLEYEVTAYQLYPIDHCSFLCRQFHFNFLNEGGKVKEIQSHEALEFPPNAIIIDGIFGTGFSGVIEEPIASIIAKANASKRPIIAIDIPSGLNGNNGEVTNQAIIATKTAFLGLPKTGFFIRDGWDYVGHLTYVNYGLPSKYIDLAEADMIMLSSDMIQPLLPKIRRKRQKYEAGQVIGLAGSPLMPGAALLASFAALCSGAGIVKLLYREGMKEELSSGPYELIKLPYDIKDIKKISQLINRSEAAFIGPGLGLEPEIRQLLTKLFAQLEKPCVVDADALTIIAEEGISPPKNSIYTPHYGELKRLLKTNATEHTMPYFKNCIKYAEEKQITLICKGAPSFIFHPGQPILVSPRGSPGMATAGSGDVLTGLIASLLAQKLDPLSAALLGVYIHGISGEFAAEDLTPYCMTASDIMGYFPDAFRPINWID